MQVKSELESEKNKSTMLHLEIRDCVDARRFNSRSGVVFIYLDNDTALQVYCDQDTDGGGWVVFQRRQDSRVDFHRNWTSYQNGFGDVMESFWLGLDALHTLTSGKTCELRVDLMMFNGTKGYATYGNFSIGDSSSNYTLRFSHYTGGNAGDSLLYHRNMQFSTYDADHDTSRINCAKDYRGGWWFRACVVANLNAYYRNFRQYQTNVVFWNDFDRTNSLKFAEMKLRPV